MAEIGAICNLTTCVSNLTSWTIPAAPQRVNVFEHLSYLSEPVTEFFSFLNSDSKFSKNFSVKSSHFDESSKSLTFAGKIQREEINQICDVMLRSWIHNTETVMTSVEFVGSLKKSMFCFFSWNCSNFNVPSLPVIFPTLQLAEKREVSSLKDIVRVCQVTTKEKLKKSHVG